MSAGQHPVPPQIPGMSNDPVNAPKASANFPRIPAPPRQTKTQQVEAQAKELARLAYSERIFGILKADLAKAGAVPLDVTQTKVIKAAMRLQYDGFAEAVRLESAKLFSAEANRLKSELGRSEDGSSES